MERGLTEEDLEVAEASVRFAMENCPVEGLLSRQDGTPISLDDLQSLLERVEEVEKTPGLDLGGDAVMTLKSVIGYTNENCPADGVAAFHDGRPISGSSIMTLEMKLKGRDSPESPLANL